MSNTCDGKCGSEESVVNNSFKRPAMASSAQSSIYKVPKMDCPSEERMIRMALTGFDSILSLSFDLSNRKLEIIHRGETGAISSKQETMGLGASLQRTEEASPESVRATESSSAKSSDGACPVGVVPTAA